MATITVHHWPDFAAGLREMTRVARSRVVIMTFDGDVLGNFWLNDYSPEVIAVERRRYPAISAITAALGGRVTVTSVPVPRDCSDGFGEAYYARPERFLEPAVLASQSGFGFVADEAVERFVASLRVDLDSGRWDERYGHLRTQPEFHGSLRLIVADLSGRPSV